MDEEAEDDKLKDSSDDERDAASVVVLVSIVGEELDCISVVSASYEVQGAKGDEDNVQDDYN